MSAKLVNVLAGFFLFVLLAEIFRRSLGDGAVAAFGTYGTVLLIVNPLNMMFAQGTLQVVSQLVSSHPQDMDGVFRRCLSVQVPLVLAALLLFEAAAPYLAEHLLNDASYTPHLRVGGLVSVFYAGRCVYQGWCNGTGRFGLQAAIDAGASLARMVFVLAAAALGYGALGAVGGFALSAAVMLVVAVLAVRPGPGGPALGVPVSRVLRFQALVLPLTLTTYLALSMDQLAVKAFSHADPAVADRLAGYFTAGMKVAQVPWSVVVGVAWVLFPLVARQSSQLDGRARAHTVRQGFRAVLLLLVPVSAVLGSNAQDTIMLLFPGFASSMERFGDSPAVVGGPLVVMALGYLLFGLLMVATMLLTAAGQPGRSLALMALVLAVGRPLGVALVQAWGPVGASVGSAVAFAVGLVPAVLLLLRAHGAFLAPMSALRIVLAGALTWAAGAALPGAGLMLLVEDLLLMVLFFGLLLACRELRLSELSGIVAAVRGRRTA